MLENIFGDWLTGQVSEILGSEGGLVQTIVAGVITSTILETFRTWRRARAGQTQSQTMPEPERRRSWIGGFFRHIFFLALAVVGGVAIAMYAGRYLLDMGLVERPFPMVRLGLLIGGTILCFSILSMFRRR